MKCEFCGGIPFKKKVRKVHWLDQRLYIVDDVQAEDCAACDELYDLSNTLDALDRTLRAGRQVIKQELQVQVVAMPA